MSGTIEDLDIAPAITEPPEAAAGRRPLLDTLARASRLGRTRVGLGIWVLLLAIALLGPLVAPHSPTEFVGAPNQGPGGGLLFGADTLGRDVLSRFLSGGRSVIVLSLLAAGLGVGAGVTVGIVAAASKGRADELIMRIADVIMAFPQIIFVLLLLAGLGPHLWLIVLAVAFTHAPHTARVMRGAALDVVERDFVRAAQAMGERRSRIMFGEILPNVTSTLLVEFGLRLTYSIALIAGISFLGFGLQPPSADWGLMINENRLAIVEQPWAVLLPGLAIALLTVGTNLVTDGIARAYVGIDRRKG
ncbi:MAG TPA: ABC transporter permease [Baekduia sp.]|nr:ABC transporter permease [Baekduia sp.]